MDDCSTDAFMERGSVCALYCVQSHLLEVSRLLIGAQALPLTFAVVSWPGKVDLHPWGCRDRGLPGLIWYTDRIPQQGPDKAVPGQL